MKKTKKLLACLIAAATMFTMGSTAFAETETTPTDHETVTIHKQYKLVGQGTSPAETFTLKQVGDGRVTDGDATNAPHLGEITGAAFVEGAATAKGTVGNITVALPKYDTVGVYEYTLKEVAGTTAGVSYYGKEIILKVTVVNGDDGNLRIAAVHTEAVGEAKSDSFENTYSAGTLEISKKVTGNLGDKDKYFAFDVTLNGDSTKTTAKSFEVGKTSYKDNPTSIELGKKTIVYLKDGETLDIKNLPYGLTYTVEEHDYTTKEGYTTTVNEKNGRTLENQTVKDGTEKAEFVNNKNNDKIDTGVNLTTLPYILVFAGVIVIAGAAFITRRRKFED